jgi:purple acid phosphatase-like protein
MPRAAGISLSAALTLVLVTAAVLAGNAGALAGPQHVSINAVKPGASSAVVAWSVDMPARVAVQYGVDGRFGVWSATSAVTSADSGTTTLSGLEPNTTYQFRVLTNSGQGVSTADGSFRTGPLSTFPQASITPPVVATAAGTSQYFASPTAHSSAPVPTGPTALYVNGSGLFPRMVWRQCPYGYGQNLAAGINLFLGTACTSPKSQLNQLEGKALSALDENTRGQVSGPGLIGWHLPDEADETIFNPSKLPLIKDAGRVTFLTLTDHFVPSNAPPSPGRDVYPPLYARTDVVGFDTYPIESRCNVNLLPNTYWQQRELIRQQPGKPTFQWIEAGPMERCFRVDPTPQTVIAESWLSIAAGARGIGFFPGVWSADIQKAITQVDRDIVALSPALLDRTSLASANSASGVLVGVRMHQGATYVIAVNPTTSTRPQVHITIAGLDSRLLQVFDENRTVAAVGDQIVDDFPPLSARIYIAPPVGW